MEAIILAGGFGTRLKHIVSDVPKPMAPVSGKPFIEYILNDLNQKGFKRIILAVGYKSETILNYFGSQYKNIELNYSYEDEPLGTGGAIKKVLEHCFEKEVFIINGDTFFDVDFSEMLKVYENKNSDIMIATKEMFKYDRYGTIIINANNEIIQFDEKKYNEKGLINGGIYLIQKDCLKNIREKQFSFETEILESLKYQMISYESKGYFIDIGIPEDYYQAQKDFENVL